MVFDWRFQSRKLTCDDEPSTGSAGALFAVWPSVTMRSACTYGSGFSRMP
jgi:hypothetical protein